MYAQTFFEKLREAGLEWWADSAVPSDIADAAALGASGVTTNPLLTQRAAALHADGPPSLFPLKKETTASERAEEITRRIVMPLAGCLRPVYEGTGARSGYVCAQVDPNDYANTEAMIGMGKRIASWAPNIAVKIPATMSGILAIEELAALGITTVGTVSFTVAQAVAIAAHQQRGIERAKRSGVKAPRAFSVLMMGRLDAYIRSVAADNGIPLRENDCLFCAVLCFQKLHELFCSQGFESTLMPAAIYGTHHLAEIMKPGICISLPPALYANICGVPEPTDGQALENVLSRLLKVGEFKRAYDCDGLRMDDFIGYGAVQRTITQFTETGWNQIGK